MQPSARRALFIGTLVLAGIAQLGLSGSAGFAAFLVVLARSQPAAKPAALTAPVLPAAPPTSTEPTTAAPTIAPTTPSAPGGDGGGGGGGGGCDPIEVISGAVLGSTLLVEFQASSPAQQQACRDVAFTIWFGSYDTGAVYHLAASSSFVIHLGERRPDPFGGRRPCGYWEVVQFRPLSMDVPASQPNDGPTIGSWDGPTCPSSTPSPHPTVTQTP